MICSTFFVFSHHQSLVRENIMGPSQIDIYMNEILSQLTEEENRLGEGREEIIPESGQPSSSLDCWMAQIQSMLDDIEPSSEDSVSSSMTIILFDPFIHVVPKDGSGDDVSLMDSESNNVCARDLPSPTSSPSSPSNVPSSSSASSDEGDSSDEYSDSSLHGSHLGPPPLDEDTDQEMDQIPLGRNASYAVTKPNLFNFN